MTDSRRRLIICAAAGLAVFPLGATLAAENIIRRGLDLLKNPTSTTPAALSTADISAGLKEALALSAEKVVKQVGATDGFNKDPAIHIPLPSQLNTVKNALSRVGMAGTLTDLELRLNRAAEAAAPVARELFLQSVKDMTLTDANGILRGGNDAATAYFKRTMSPALSTRMQPIVQQSLAQVGAATLFDQAMTRYRAIPLAPPVNFNLNDYVVQRAMDGIFHYMAVEEAAIRSNPVARTTDLLKRVFGN